MIAASAKLIHHHMRLLRSSDHGMTRMMSNLTVEEGLRQVEDRAAMLRFFADGMVRVDSVPDPAMFSGLGDVLAQIEDIVRSARLSLDAQALSTDLKPAARR
jgi:hypothetical protein